MSTEIHDTSTLLGKFVALGKLILDESYDGELQTSLHTEKNLDFFISNVDKHMPLYLDLIDQQKKISNDEKMEDLFKSLDKVYSMISYVSFKNYQVDKDSFIKGYYEGIETSEL